MFNEMYSLDNLALNSSKFSVATPHRGVGFIVIFSKNLTKKFMKPYGLTKFTQAIIGHCKSNMLSMLIYCNFTLMSVITYQNALKYTSSIPKCLSYLTFYVNFDYLFY
jgi:hypothetical protein